LRDRSVNIVHGKIVLYRKNHKKNTKTICEKKQSFFVLQQVVHIITVALYGAHLADRSVLV